MNFSFLFILLYLILQLYKQVGCFWRGGFSFQNNQNGVSCHLSPMIFVRSCLQGWEDGSLQISKASITTSCSHGEALGLFGQGDSAISRVWRKKKRLGWMTRMDEYIYIYNTHNKIEQHLGKEKHIFPFYTSKHCLYINCCLFKSCWMESSWPRIGCAHYCRDPMKWEFEWEPETSRHCSSGCNWTLCHFDIF